VHFILLFLGITLPGRYATWLAIARPSAPTSTPLSPSAAVFLPLVVTISSRPFGADAKKIKTVRLSYFQFSGHAPGIVGGGEDGMSVGDAEGVFIIKCYVQHLIADMDK